MRSVSLSVKSAVYVLPVCVLDFVGLKVSTWVGVNVGGGVLVRVTVTVYVSVVVFETVDDNC